MNRFIVTAAVSAAAGIAAGLVQQASAQERAPFTGPRVEAMTGYDRTSAPRPAAGAPDKVDGVYVGGAAGYDLALGRTVRVGAEAGIGWSLDDAARGQVGTSTYRLSSGRDVDLSLRVGAAVAPRTLLYAKAGYANSRYEARVTGPGALRVAGNEEGLRVGAGVEQALGRHAYVKGEYRYTTYGHELDRHQVLAGVGYRF